MSDPRYGDEAVSLALTCLKLLERVRPIERSVFLLHDVFGRTHAETARIVGVTAVVACMSSEPDTTEAAAGRDAVAAQVGLLDADRILSIEVARGLVQTVRLK